MNFFMVLLGVYAFVPRTIEADRPAAIADAGSKQGVAAPPGKPAQSLSEAAVRVPTEQPADELRTAGASISAHLLVPGHTCIGMTARASPEKTAAARASARAVDYFLAPMAEGDLHILCPDVDVDVVRDRRRVAWSAGDVTENRPALSRRRSDHAEAFAAFGKAGRHRAGRPRATSPRTFDRPRWDRRASPPAAPLRPLRT